MRTVAVLMGIVSLVIFSIFLLLAAPLSRTSLATPVLAGLMEQPAPGGVFYKLSDFATRHLSVYFLLVMAICVTMMARVVKKKISDLAAWLFVGVTVLLNVLAIVSIHLVADYSMPRM